MNYSPFPIKIFNVYDNETFKSVSNIQKNFKENWAISDYITYITKSFKEEKNQKLLIQLVSIFPYLFFSNAQKISKENIKNHTNVESSIHNIERLTNILNFRFNYKEIIKHLKVIKDVTGIEISYSAFVTQLFIISYKYAFIELSESIYWSNEDGDKLSMTYKKLFELRDNAQKTLEDTSKIVSVQNSHLFFKRKEARKFIQSYNNSISEDISIIKSTEIGLKNLTNNSYLSKVLYSIIDSTVEITINLTNTEKNKLLRPLFYHIVCPFCYPKVLDHEVEHSSVIEKYRNFLKTY